MPGEKWELCCKAARDAYRYVSVGKGRPSSEARKVARLARDAKAKELGLCLRCHIRHAEDGKCSCEKCLKLARDKEAMMRRLQATAKAARKAARMAAKEEGNDA